MFPHYSAKNLFFAELIGKTIVLPNIIYIPLFIVNGFLIWLIGRKLFKNNSHVPVIVYLLSPWFYYLTLAHSFYMFLLFLVLLVIFGLVNLLSGNKTLGAGLVTTGTVMAAYSSSLLFFLLPIMLFALVAIKIFSLKLIRTSGVVILILFIPLLFLIGKNKIGFTNNLRNETKIFSDPGLLNSVNRYQGAADTAGYKNLARVSENKYLFFAEYSALKYATQLVPGTFFTPQHKLLGFSFNPPILLAFLFPFLYGLYKSFQNSKIRWVIFLSTLLTIPSILAKDYVSLNRLVIFAPVVVFIISLGLIQFITNKNNKTLKIISIVTVVLVLFQLIVSLSDIKFRGSQRFERYLGTNYELTEP
jgi:hypothetical protein